MAESNQMKKYYKSLRSLLTPNYNLKVYNANHHLYSAPQSGNSMNLRLIRANKKAELTLHRLYNGVEIAWGYTISGERKKNYGTKIRALVVLAALKANMPLYQYSVGGKNSGSYKIMKKLGALNNKNAGENHFKFVPGRHNLKKLASKQ
jgi:hypothetical protein